MEKVYYNSNDYKDLMEEAFVAMPLSFTSRQFGQKARFLGVPKKLISEGFAGRFLSLGNKTIKLSRFVYQKADNKISLNNQAKIILPSEEEEQAAITLLKALGYKVLKEVKEFKEL